MKSVEIVANNYQIIDRIIRVLDIISSVTENSSLYSHTIDFLIQLNDIKNNYSLRWYETHDNLVLELYNLFANGMWWKNDFIMVYMNNYRYSDYYEGCKRIKELFEEIDNIALCLDKIMHIDYDKMRKDNRDFFSDLNKYVLKPERIERISGQFGIEFFDYLDSLDV